MERFKGLMKPKNLDEYVPELFNADRLFDFSDGHTNHNPEKEQRFERYYDDMKQKYSNLAYIGDKVSNTFRVAETIHQKFPNTRYLFIFRDIYDSAASWNARAERDGDNWPANKTGDRAVSRWNETSATYLKLKKKAPADFYAIDYHNFFGNTPGDLTPLNELMSFLEISTDKGQETAYLKATNYYHEQLSKKPRFVNDKTRQYIDEHADFDSWNQLMGKLSVSTAA